MLIIPLYRQVLELQVFFFVTLLKTKVAAQARESLLRQAWRGKQEISHGDLAFQQA